MKKLEKLSKLTEIESSKTTYIVFQETQPDGLNYATKLLRGAGFEVIEHLKQVFDYDEWNRNYREEKDLTLPNFLTYCDENNGDLSFDYIEVTKLNQ